MSLLDRYLNAVRNHLPAAQQDDIVAELGDDLRARFEERAAELGRPLTEADEAELLKPFGRPLQFAARYRPRQYLIGPDVFPYYWTTLRFVLAVAFVVLVTITVTFTLAGRPHVAGGLWKGAVNIALSVFTWVTLVFAMIDAAAGHARKWDDWDPRSLPRETRPAPPLSRFEVGLDLVLSSAFVAVWVAMPHSQWLRTLANSGLELAPAWWSFYLPVLVVVLASMAAKTVAFLRPGLTTFRFVAGLLTTAAGIVILALLLGAGDLVLAGAADPRLEVLARTVNMALRMSFVIAIVANAVTTVRDTWRYLRGRHVRFA